ncbi:MAG: biotin--[acetyl-CoA-carboxylase] ligase [Betaproteobacteria bacterium]|nr:biotin--[acetyl-CoA-carboxylase] ligase [Betaproteobacteria bacterium]
MNALTFQALRMLADGEFRSGEAMARSLGVSRASVWNALHALDALGLDVFRVRGRGYRLAEPLSLLDRTAVERQLGAHAPRFALEVLDSAESTNTLLMRRAAGSTPGGSVIAAEWQTHGRGRRGRPWHSTPGAALTFSLLWRFQQGVGFLVGLSLAVGVAVARTLTALGVDDAGLKWPNDVLWRGGKLAGILIEMQGDTLGPSAVVIGVGLNCRLPDALRERIDQPVADLATACGAAPDRNRVLALLLIELERVLNEFARSGFAPLRDEWQHRHIYQGKAVELALPDGGVVSGTAEGVAEDGALLLATRTGQQRFHSGEVSLRGSGEAKGERRDAAGGRA